MYKGDWYLKEYGHWFSYSIIGMFLLMVIFMLITECFFGDKADLDDKEKND